MNHCEPCGLHSDYDGHFEQHCRSVSHTKIKLIRAMLEKNCIPHTEIAKRVGLSRERIRQISQRIGLYTGRERMMQCTIDSKQPLPLAGFFLKCAERGLDVTMTGQRSGIVNGKACLQRCAVTHDIRLRRPGKTYVYRVWHIAAPMIEFDVCAWCLPDGKFLILPRELVRFKATGFRPEENNGNRKGSYGSNHYYRDFIERWDVLDKTTDTALANKGPEQLAASGASAQQPA